MKKALLPLLLVATLLAMPLAFALETPTYTLTVTWKSTDSYAPNIYPDYITTSPLPGIYCYQCGDNALVGAGADIEQSPYWQFYGWVLDGVWIPVVGGSGGGIWISMTCDHTLVAVFGPCSAPVHLTSKPSDPPVRHGRGLWAPVPV